MQKKGAQKYKEKRRGRERKKERKKAQRERERERERNRKGRQRFISQFSTFLPAHTFQRCLGQFVGWPQDVSMVLRLAPADHRNQLGRLQRLPDEGPVAKVGHEFGVGENNLLSKDSDAI